MQPEVGAPTDLVALVEAILYAADGPLTAGRIAELLDGVARDDGGRRAAIDPAAIDPAAIDPAAIDPAAIDTACSQLERRYRAAGSGLQVVQVARGYRLGTRNAFHPWIRALRQAERPSPLSVPLLETLAVIAYRQPVTIAEISAIRGKDPVASVRRLRELGLARVVGRKRTVGRPFTYGTTQRFLETFGLRDLDELPAPEEFQELLEA